MVTVEIAHPEHQSRRRPVPMLVDTGAALSKLPGSVLTDLNCNPSARFRSSCPMAER